MAGAAGRPPRLSETAELRQFYLANPRLVVAFVTKGVTQGGNFYDNQSLYIIRLACPWGFHFVHSVVW